MRRILLALVLLVPAPVVAQEMQQQRVILWEEPPVIGMSTTRWSIVPDTIPGIATADWPDFIGSVYGELTQCTGLQPDSLPSYRLKTVAAPVFGVTVWQDKAQEWYVDRDFIGYTFPDLKTIYVAQGGARSRKLLKHELLHALLAEHGLPSMHHLGEVDAMFDKCFPQ